MTERRTIQRFQILAVLGDGGMGTVYRARDPQLERDVAIKVLKATGTQARSELSTQNTVDLRGRGGSKKRDDLLQEARMMARLSHPNVVPIFEVGLDEAGDVFVVMEYVAGDDLRHWLKTERAPADIARVFAQAARGLAAAHERGIIHRDFKPDNVLIGSDGRARVTDFGISKLAEPTSLVHAAKVAGTPKYMAPELWRGLPATPASDVFALCTTFVEAFGDGAFGDRASEPVAELVQRGLAEKPADRPALDEIIAALDGHVPRSRARVVAIGAVAVAALGTGVAFAMTSSSDEAPCDVGVSTWDAAKRAGVRASLVGSASDIDRLLAMFDKRASEITALHRGVCEAAAAKRLTTAQAEQQHVCLALRAIELASVVDADKDLIKTEIRFNRTSLPVSCNALAVSARDPAALAPLYARFVKAGDLAAEPALVEYAAIEAAARAAGDPELAAKAVVNLGARQRNVDQLDASTETLRRAYSEAMTIASPEVATNAVTEHLLTINNTKDMVQTKTLGEMVKDLARSPATTPRARLRLLRSIGRTTTARGDTRAAIEIIRAAIADAGKLALPNRDLDVLLRVDLAEALLLLGDNIPEAIKIAREAVELARVQGERTNNYGLALNLLSKCYLLHNDFEEALDYRRRALAVFTAIFPAEHSAVIEARVDLGIALYRASQFEAAHRELVDAVGLASKATAMRRSYPWMLSRLAHATAEVGHGDEAVRLFEQAIDTLSSTVGSDHPQTLDQRFNHAVLVFELGRVDDADRIAKALELSYAANPLPKDKRSARLRGWLAADIARARNKPLDAERLARRAVEELTELGAEGELAIARRHLGEALVDQGRFAEAHEVLATAFAAATAQHVRADDLATFELALASAEAGLGKRDEARARAERIEPVLARYPAARTARKQVTRLLAR